MNDLRLTLRQLLKNPGFTAVAVLTLALGIGASLTVFSLIQGVLLTPPPYPHPDRLMLITPSRTDGQHYTRGWPAAQWQAWGSESSALESVACYGWNFNFLVLPEGSESVEGLAVTHEYFKVMGIQPALGRAFEDSDIPAAGPQTAIILGHELWKRRFNGDPKVIGQPVRLSRRPQPLTIIGVMPPDIRFLPSPNVTSEPNYNVDAKVDYWVPVRPDPKRAKRPDWNLVGRLRPGVTVPQAQAELSSLIERQIGDDADFAGIRAKLNPVEVRMNEEGRRLLIPLAGAVLLVFLIACGNAAGLLLARGLQRHHEYGVRAALGAGPLDLCRPVLVESLLLAGLGALAGAMLAGGCVNALKILAGSAIPRLDAVRLGWPVWLFSLAAAAVAGLIAGLLPAWRSLSLDPATELKAGSRTASEGRTERRLLGSLAAVQIALTFALLVGAALLVQTAHSLARVRPGFNTEQILTLSVTAVGTNWLDFHTQALERTARLPGVKAAAFAWGVPLTGNKWHNTFDVPGLADADSVKNGVSLPTRSVTPDYFHALGLTIKEGRGFRASDDEKAPRVGIINQALADRYFPGGNPIGQALKFKDGGTNRIEIIGVLANARTESLTDEAEPELYFSFWQFGAFSKHLVIKSQVDPLSVAVTVQRELRAIDPTVSIENIKTLGEIRADSVAARTFAMNLLIGFAAVACVLATVSIYGVLSLTVNSRRNEIAIRLAVGARREDIQGLILGGGLRLAAAGIGLGLVVALGLAAGLKTYLFGVTATDPMTLLAMIVLILTITLGTCWIPARRATHIEPLAALRNE